MTATACCTSKPIIYQIQLVTTSSKFTPILSRNTSSSIISLSDIQQPLKITKTSENDVNNNKNHSDYDIIYIDSPQENLNIINNDNDNDNQTMDNINAEQFLSCVGLRHKTKTKIKPILTTRSLAKRLATPVCLLPLSERTNDRVRQALYILLPYLKFLSITHDIELFCSTDEKAKAESLLPRSGTQTRTSKTIHRNTNKRKVSKSGKYYFIR